MTNPAYKIVKDRVDKKFKALYANNLQKFPEQEPKNFKELSDYKRFIEIEELQQAWWEPYIRTKFFLKEFAFKDKIDPKNKEEVFYDWLKVCINSENDPTIDFYFKIYKLSKEEQVKEILFENQGQGELKKIFKESDEWQIRLRKIRTWFLKRYDLGTAIKLHSELTNKKCIEYLDLVPLRLISATLIGFIPLLFDSKVWTLPLQWGNLTYITILIIPILLVLIYFMYECYKTIDGEKDTRSIFKRVLPVFGLGLLFSFIFSFIFYTILSNQFVPFEKDSYTCFYPLRIIPFFAIIALSIGVIVQIIWEDKTATEPL